MLEIFLHVLRLILISKQNDYAGNIPARVEVNLISKQNMLVMLLYSYVSYFQAEYAGNAPV